MATVEEITAQIEKTLAGMGLELYEIKHVRAGANSVLRIFIDKDGGVTIDDCEKASTQLSTLLDVENFSATPYRLEVSSPGLDRPLKTERDYRRVTGETLKLRVRSPEGKENVLIGRLINCDQGALHLQVKEENRVVPLDTVLSGKVELMF